MSIEVKLHESFQLDQDEWRQLQSIQREAFLNMLDRSQDEIDYLVQWDDPRRFYDSHYNPNREVGGKFNEGQSYTVPRVAVATENNEPVGFAYSAHNVSGSTMMQRTIKRLTIVKNYLWLREVAVLPDYQRHGVAKDLGRKLLRDAIAHQPVAAYVWPGEIPYLPGVLHGYGFRPTGERQIKLYGEDRPSIKQVRMQAQSAREVLQRIS